MGTFIHSAAVFLTTMYMRNTYDIGLDGIMCLIALSVASNIAGYLTQD